MARASRRRIPLALSGRHGLGMVRLDDRVPGRGQEAIDEVRAGDRLRLRAPVAFELGPDTSEGGEGPIVVEGEPDDVLLGLWVRLRRVFGEAVHRHQAAILRLQPAAPVRQRRVADIGDRRPASAPI
jgi:hypothetical protein